MNICTACGFSGYLERHHVGGRKYSPIVTKLCKPCHDYCTVADVYERVWPISTPYITRIWAGVCDIWARFGYCYGLETTRIVLNDAEYRKLWSYKACSQIAADPCRVSIETVIDQLTELDRLDQEVINYVLRS